MSQEKSATTTTADVKKPASKPPTYTPPNRTFSFTSVLGNVKVQIALPNASTRPKATTAVRKNYILLPEHRPPLRRDKPVRISLPDAVPRYIFPSPDRSFIFIPRAMRPNQQTAPRARGRGSFHGSRRPSVYGSGYTPSVAMSRKSSLGGSVPRDGVRSPTDSTVFRSIGITLDSNARPIVRMPSVGPPLLIPQAGMPIANGQYPVQPVVPMPVFGSQAAPIPMHQPRPQKAVSVADIETPASFPFKAPEQQQQQPFHQQVPNHVTNNYGEDKSTAAGPGMAGTTPLSQIPEGMVFAPTFQPFAQMGQQPYFNAPYNGAVFYPSIPDPNAFAMPMPAPVLAPSFVPGSQSHPVNYMADPNMAAGMMGQDPNGTMYFYNTALHPAQMQQQYPMAPNGNMMSMVNGVPQQAPFFYPSMQAATFYPGQSG
jgi:hypothetical protein